MLYNLYYVPLILDTFDSWKYFQSSRNVEKDVYIFIVSALGFLIFLLLVAGIQVLVERFLVKRRSKKSIYKKFFRKPKK